MTDKWTDYRCTDGWTVAQKNNAALAHPYHEGK